MNNESTWIDVIEDVPEQGYNTTTIRLSEPLGAEETMHEWLASHGYSDVVDFRLVIGEWVTSWSLPQLEWIWIQNMTEPYPNPKPSHN